MIALVIGLQSCTTHHNTGRFSVTQLEESVYQVNYRGNAHTSTEEASDFTLLRSAELTIEKGYTYFMIVDSRNDTKLGSYTTPRTSVTNLNLNKSGGTTYGTATTNSYGGQTFIFSKPSAANTIVCLKEKPREGFAYNAEMVAKSLSEKYGIKKK